MQPRRPTPRRSALPTPLFFSDANLLILSRLFISFFSQKISSTYFNCFLLAYRLPIFWCTDALLGAWWYDICRPSLRIRIPGLCWLTCYQIWLNSQCVRALRCSSLCSSWIVDLLFCCGFFHLIGLVHWFYVEDDDVIFVAPVLWSAVIADVWWLTCKSDSRITPKSGVCWLTCKSYSLS